MHADNASIELLIQQSRSVETPRRAIVKIEVAIGAEVLARKELSICAGHKVRQLLVGQRIELIRCDRLADSESWSVHGRDSRLSATGLMLAFGA
jgi:hypothetical protein